MKLCKLTTQDLTTHNGFQWELGAWREAKGMGTMPCTPDVLHYYHHPILASMFNHIHANITNPRLFEIEIDEELGTDGMKGWCKHQRLVREIQLPVLSKDIFVEFSIRVAMLVHNGPTWVKWANEWLDGTNRTKESIYCISYPYLYSRGAFSAKYAVNSMLAGDEISTLYAAVSTCVYAGRHQECNMFLSNILKIVDNLNIKRDLNETL